MPAVAKPWAGVLPVKRLDQAKTRLDVGAALRAELALAMAVDTARACLATPSVRQLVVVTDDPRAAEAMRAMGALVVPDEPDAGLNPALEHGARLAAEAAYGAGVFAVSADLPALAASDLEHALRAALRHAVSCVADRSGTGTTMLAAQRLDNFRPAFGDDSLRRHLASGASDLSAAVASALRRDVDTVADLREASALGCGPATRSVIVANSDRLTAAETSHLR
jgi:2-phospho-L-lactate/phosphoenolpyruvate guanylyltransferase